MCPCLCRPHGAARSKTEDVYFICGDSPSVAICCFLQRRMLSPFNIGILQRPVVCREPFVPSHGSKDLTRLPFNVRTHGGVLLPEDLLPSSFYMSTTPPLPHPTCKRAKTNARNPFELTLDLARPPAGLKCGREARFGDRGVTGYSADWVSDRLMPSFAFRATSCYYTSHNR